ncbi:MAG: hypothetical protein HQK49_16855 [Oligoflexia bacterium]|nr:hypothetical protein [Oligoflexia bacterium]
MNYDLLLSDYKRQIIKGMKYLDHSYQKIQKLLLSSNSSNSSNTPTSPIEISNLDFDHLEILEAFISRFARVTDIFLSKYVRTYIKKNDPAFHGSLLDSLNMAAKLNLISEVNRWMNIRELRNSAAHEYTEESLGKYYQSVIEETPFIFQELKRIFQDEIK